MNTTEKCPLCGKPFHSPGGRSLRLTDSQIAGILLHCRAEFPKHTIKHYCEEIGISTYTYRSIVRMTLKQSKDIERVIAIKTALDNERSEDNE
ncbi:hypothetical protein CLCHR_06990 [Clostridium chromiireducens]|uniref:Uncharacterized protein n=1 Tax=Clostridium chromiireducens TaxID=225345 RepID=A0A1V4J1H3_9CLOT|nr:hypothetical protein CLCHR_06990 [Clostridium chromiireducens]